MVESRIRDRPAGREFLLLPGTLSSTPTTASIREGLAQGHTREKESGSPASPVVLLNPWTVDPR